MVLRIAWIVLSLGFLLFANSNAANAAIVFTSSTATFGPVQNLTGLGTFLSPNNVGVGGGVTVTALAGTSSINNATGLIASTGTVTFNFASPVRGFGVLSTTAANYNVSFGGTAETNSVGPVVQTANSFAGFFSNTNTNFSSATLTLTGGSLQLTSFRTITAIPEPTTILTGGLGMLVAAGASVARRKKRTGSDKGSGDQPNPHCADNAV